MNYYYEVLIMIYFILSSVNFVFFQMFFWKSCNNLKMRTLGYEMFGGKFSTTISWKRCVFDGTHQNPKTSAFHLLTVLSSLFIEWQFLFFSKFMKSNQMKKHDSNGLGQDHVNCLKKWILHIKWTKLIDKIIETTTYWLN